MIRHLFFAAVLLSAAPALADQPAPTPDVLAALHLKSCRVVDLRVAADQRISIDLGTAQAPRPVTFVLDPYPLRTPGFKLIVSNDKGDMEIPAPPPSTFHAVDPLSGDELWACIVGASVRATIVPGRPGAPFLYIQPLAEAGPAAAGIDPALHALYASTDILPLNATCGNDACPACNSTPGASTPTFVPRGPGSCKYVEMTAECDWPFYLLNSGSASNCVQDVEAVMLGVNALYRNTAGFTPQIRFALQRVAVRATNASDPYTSYPVPPAEADPNQMLPTELSFWNAQSASTPDVVHLFTGRDLTGSIVGLAYVNALCGSARYGLAQSRFTVNLASRAAVSAHEIGHNLSFTHDASGATTIMAPAISSPAPTIFSAQSVSQYTTNIAGFACLNNTYPDVLPDSAQTLPGVPITIDVLANDGQGVICTAAVTSFTLPSATSALGGSIVVSVGTGPGGRNQITYTPAIGASGVVDSFNYTAGGVSVPVTVHVVTPRPPDQPYTAVVAGLAATYYDIRNANGSVTLFSTMPALATYPIFGTGISAQLDYPLSAGNAVGSTRNFGMGAIFRGFIQVPTTAFYQLWTVSDDLSRVSIGSTIVVDNGSVQTAGEATGTIALAPGRHALTVEYTNFVGNTQLVLSYAYPGQSRITVPAAALWSAAGPCHADFNGVGGVNVQDIFDFLAAWFAGLPAADFNGLNGITVQDIFDFLGAWFGPC